MRLPVWSTHPALSAMGRRPGFQPGKASSSLARATRCRSSSNGESARLRTGRLGDHTLRAAPLHRDRLTGRTWRSERQYRGSNPCPGAISLRSSTAERPRDMREGGRSSRPVGTITRCGWNWQTRRPQKAVRGNPRGRSNRPSATNALVAQPAEATGSKPVECWFESSQEHHAPW